MIWFVVVLVIVFVGGAVLSYFEGKRYNHGICKCGGKLKSFDMDSQGAVGFECESCDNTVWVHGLILWFLGE